MGLTNPQLEKILREYDRRQIRNRADQEDRIRHAMQSIPELKDMEEAISDLSLQRAKALLQGDTEASSRYGRQLSDVKEGKKVLLRAKGLSENYLDMQYQCEDCRDTGYIGGEKCHCLKQAIADLLFRQYSVREQFKKENFSTFSFELFDQTEQDPYSGLTAYENIKKIYHDSLRYVEDFVPGKENLLLMGETGTGKTFLSNCIANALMERGFSVVYLPANQLFDVLAEYSFKSYEDNVDENYYYILNSDLLIVDDLGTELNNSFVSSKLFCCINERRLNNKSTIISTNLSLNQIRDSYSERVSSRLLESYRIFRFYNSDIRVKKRLMGRNG